MSTTNNILVGTQLLLLLLEKAQLLGTVLERAHSGGPPVSDAELDAAADAALVARARALAAAKAAAP